MHSHSAYYTAKLRLSAVEDLQDEVGQLVVFVDLVHGLLEVLRVQRAPDVAVPHRILLALQLNQVQLLQFQHCSLQHILGVDERAAGSLGGHQLLLELQVDLVDGLEAEGSALVLGHVVDNRHDDVLRVRAG